MDSQRDSEVRIPLERVERALSSAAVPGANGRVEVEFRIKPEAVDGVDILVLRSIQQQAQKEPVRLAASGMDAERGTLVAAAVAAMSERLRVRLDAVKISAFYQDGRLMKYELVDVP